MPSTYENTMYERGRTGGDRPGPFDSEQGRDAYDRGRTQREIDRSTNEALEKLHNPNYDKRDQF